MHAQVADVISAAMHAPLPADSLSCCCLPPLLLLPQEGSVFRGTYDFESKPFDWGANYRRPNIPLKDLVIAELPVRLFTGALGGLRSRALFVC